MAVRDVIALCIGTGILSALIAWFVFAKAYAWDWSYKFENLIKRHDDFLKDKEDQINRGICSIAEKRAKETADYVVNNRLYILEKHLKLEFIADQTPRGSYRKVKQEK